MNLIYFVHLVYVKNEEALKIYRKPSIILQLVLFYLNLKHIYHLNVICILLVVVLTKMYDYISPTIVKHVTFFSIISMAKLLSLFNQSINTLDIGKTYSMLKHEVIVNFLFKECSNMRLIV